MCSQTSFTTMFGGFSNQPFLGHKTTCVHCWSARLTGNGKTIQMGFTVKQGRKTMSGKIYIYCTRLGKSYRWKLAYIIIKIRRNQVLVLPWPSPGCPVERTTWKRKATWRIGPADGWQNIGKYRLDRWEALHGNKYRENTLNGWEVSKGN